MFLQPSYFSNNDTFYTKDEEDLLSHNRDSGVSKIAIKVANFDWSVIMIITTLFLCILYVCGFALLCLKAISSLGDSTTDGRGNLIPNENGSRTDISVNFGNIHNQMSNSNNERRRSDNTVIIEWYQAS
jgi:hypothetical protein